jgi:hypothetical protein
MCLAILGTALISAWDRRRPSSYKVAVGLMFLVASGTALEIAGLALRGPNPFAVAIGQMENPGASTYLLCARHIHSFLNIFRMYTAIMGAHPEAASCIDHPPGPVMLLWPLAHGMHGATEESTRFLSVVVGRALGISNLLDGSLFQVKNELVAALAALAQLFWSTLVVIPCFFLARRFAGRALALPLAGLALLVPSILLISPSFDQGYPVLAASMLAFTVEAVESKHPVLWGAFAGLSSAIALLMSYGFWILAVPMCTIAAVSLARASRGGSSDEAQRIWSAVLAAFVGFMLPWLIACWILGFHAAASLMMARDLVTSFNAKRPYSIWIGLNLIDFLQHLGPALALILTAELGRNVLSSSPAEPKDVGRRGDATNWYAYLFWCFLLALDLTGWNRGEVARLWTPLVPLALVVVYKALPRFSENAPKLVLLIATGQAAVCIAMSEFWKHYS